MGNSVQKEEEKKEDLWEQANQRRKSKSFHKISKIIEMNKGFGMSFNEEGKLVGIPDVWIDLLKIDEDLVEESVTCEELPEELVPEIDNNIEKYVQKSKPGKFIVRLPCVQDEEEKTPDCEVELDKEGETGFTGLPTELEREYNNAGFTKNDVIEDPLSVLETLACLRRQKTGSLHPLPTNSEYRRKEKENILFIKSDPSKDYIILNELGEGGFGKVYKCASITDEKIFAMKYIDITSNKQKIYIGNEITIMKTTDHANVEKLHDVYLHKGRIFMIMEYLDAGCLTPVVEDFKLDIPENVIAFILREVLQGIYSLHKRGIIHRDIKSDNILIEKDSAAIKITDFGYSCQLTQEKRMRESRVGTLYWMAPEILKGNNKYDQRCDIWSLGVFAFELAQGFPPFPKKGQQKVIYNILSKPSPKLEEEHKWSSNFNSFIECCMIKDFEERPTAAELLKHPFLARDLDYEGAKQDYMDFKEQVLKRLGRISKDFDGSGFDGFDDNTTKDRTRSKTFKKV